MKLLEAIAARRNYFFVALGVFLLDQASKIAADHLLRARGAISIIPAFFNLWYSRNRGGLFGYFASWGDPWRTILLALLPLLAMAAIAYFLATTSEPDRFMLTGLALILGGAAGNLADRAIRGEVVDFLDAYISSPRLAQWCMERFGTAHWPTFNFADSAIVVGGVLLVVDLFRSGVRPRETAA